MAGAWGLLWRLLCLSIPGAREPLGKLSFQMRGPAGGRGLVRGCLVDIGV
jgi:hypothetical protein